MEMFSHYWSQLGTTVASILFVFTLFQNYLPDQISHFLQRLNLKITSFFYPYVQITFHEFTSDSFKRSDAYSFIETYLGSKSQIKVKRLKAEIEKQSQSLVLSIDDYEEVSDDFNGVKIWWASSKNLPKTQTVSFYPSSDEKRFYKLTFHKKDRNFVIGSYLNHVLKEGKKERSRNRQRKLYTNSAGEQWSGCKKAMWNHIVFEHPVNFNTLAMDPKKKEEIIYDLVTFTQSKEYYAKIGKPWKRGYLLYGPPGTGKSSMIAAMANFLGYDIYDLELTAVKNNTNLRKLLIETSSKSIIVIEDIDCTLDLTGQRKAIVKEKDDEDGEESEDRVSKEKKKIESENEVKSKKSSEVTLSGLLNMIDGLWSACEGERLIVFTTNYVDKLDPALIRRGRMDKHIEMTYCCFEAFRVLAKNYLDVDEHREFDKIKGLLEEINIVPADVAENLMPKTVKDNADTCLEALLHVLEAKKVQAWLKGEKEVKEKGCSAKSEV